MEREYPEVQRERHDWNIEHAEEVVPNGWRLTYPEAGLDVPQSWVFSTERGLLVIDPGGELPVESSLDTVRALARKTQRTTETPKIDAVRELEKRYEQKVSAVLLTHGDADHQNNIEQISDDTTPIFVGEKGHWSVLSPEKQFTASRVNMDKSPHTGHRSSKTLFGRDAGFQIAASLVNNPRSTLLPGSHRATRKREFANRFENFPDAFPTSAGELEVIKLPGHAPEEVGFYLPEQKLIITGDLIGTSKAGQADRINIFLVEANVYDALASIRHLKSLDIERLYPAHGPPILGREEIQNHLRQIETDAAGLIDRIMTMHKEYPDLPVQELRKKVFTDVWKREGMVEQSQESWIFSVLRDQPKDVPGQEV